MRELPWNQAPKRMRAHEMMDPVPQAQLRQKGNTLFSLVFQERMVRQIGNKKIAQIIIKISYA